MLGPQDFQMLFFGGVSDFESHCRSAPWSDSEQRTVHLCKDCHCLSLWPRVRGGKALQVLGQCSACVTCTSSNVGSASGGMVLVELGQEGYSLVKGSLVGLAPESWFNEGSSEIEPIISSRSLPPMMSSALAPPRPSSRRPTWLALGPLRVARRVMAIVSPGGKGNNCRGASRLWGFRL